MTVAFFPGKFQPPHLGHILTLLDVYDKYDKLIIGVTEGPPRVMSLDDTVKILEDIFRHIPFVVIFPIKGTLDDDSALPYLPKDWDVIVTGNEFVIDVAKEHGWNWEFIPRSKGIGYSGTELRKLYEL